jgi:hypothetical protein
MLAVSGVSAGFAVFISPVTRIIFLQTIGQQGYKQNFIQ